MKPSSEHIPRMSVNVIAQYRDQRKALEDMVMNIWIPHTAGDFWTTETEINRRLVRSS
jgi:hypothetical protein